MSATILPPQDYLHQCLEYNSESGILRWRKRPRDHFYSDRICNSWNARFPGQQLIHRDAQGYTSFTLNRKLIKAHRVIWAMHCDGTIPEFLDHISGDREDNRLCNLRPATRLENKRNSCKYKRKSDLPTGVYYSDTGGSKVYLTKINIMGRSKYLGRYTTAKEASVVYEKASTELFGEFKRLAQA